MRSRWSPLVILLHLLTAGSLAYDLYRLYRSCIAFDTYGEKKNGIDQGITEHVFQNNHRSQQRSPLAFIHPHRSPLVEKARGQFAHPYFL